MQVEKTIISLNNTLSAYKESEKKVGLVPTMGALHKGHFSLIKQSLSFDDITVVSIFVNPTQFNNKEDSVSYPRNISEDLSLISALLKENDIVFAPAENEMYKDKEIKKYDLGGLDQTMEGKHRPGHFNGVAQVVSILFDIVKPHKAFFGQKDFQQLTIIKELVKQLDLDIEIVSCPIIREENGLAMSSRNRRLDEKTRDDAAIIYKTLQSVIEKKDEKSPSELARWGKKIIANHPAIELEYFRIVNTGDLQPAKKWGGTGEQVACVAVKINNVRLIDNMIFP